ncbi:DHHC zinc finger domain containing protein [Babesia divergens]|uniref:Palmitoyltransferase n=1 Tax=Babesia divergens TaxID=32595 RepID=A0AAD9LDV2_BABDI|nr:DHHC zinc finger domain containing protein [Babesia divergens]
MAPRQLDITEAFAMVDSPTGDTESERVSPRPLSTYTSYVPSRASSTPLDIESDPLLSRQDRHLSSSKVCLRSVYTMPPPQSKVSWFHYLPVAFVLLSFTTIYGIFMCYHVKPAIKNDFNHLGVLSNKTAATLFFTHVLCALFLVNYILCASVDPGRIPAAPEWSICGNDDKTSLPTLCETKKCGGRRVCKWCYQYKPDRAHHCRVCGRCVLKMDHHCPWVHNCIGWGNHKYFFLCLFYAAVLSCVIAIVSLPTVKHAMRSPLVPFNELMMMLVGEVLSIFYCIICTLFLCFHIWLMCEAFTTIEFCEKRTSSAMLLEGSLWSGGLRYNISCVLGQNPLLWLLPIDDRVGDGLQFIAHLPVEGSDDNDEALYDENSVFLKMARETKQFEPILDV